MAADTLRPSTPDDYQLGAAVEQRFLDLSDAYLRIKGETLVFPPELNAAVLRWRAMRVRHKAGDYRHKPSEMRATKEVATWTLEVNDELRNQPGKRYQWVQ